MARNGNTEDDFWIKVEKTNPADCWMWMGSRRVDGYGQFMYQTKNWGAHRLSYFFTHGSIGKGKQILHHCDTPLCVNPDHLYEGVHWENMRDRSVRGRTAHNRGEAAGGVKLRERDVIAIRSLIATGRFTQTDIARQFGISKMAVSNIKNNQRWAHVE